MTRAWIPPRRWRRTAYLVAALVFAILSVFPRAYVARALVLPHDGSGRLAALVGDRDQKLADMLAGGRPSTNIYLLVARSDRVRGLAVDRLKLAGDEDAAKQALGDEVRIHMLLGNVIQIEARSHDPEGAKRLASVYVEAFGGALAALGNGLGLSAADAPSVQVIDPPHLVGDHAYNVWAVSLLAFVLLLALFTEVYAPLTGLDGRSVQS